MSYPPGYPSGPGYPPAGGMPQPSTAPAGLPYPAQPYPNQGFAPPGGAYPQQGSAYPPQGGAYPPQGGAYPPQGGAYPPQGGAYPPQGGAYPPQGGGYPPQGGMPTPGDAPYPSGAPVQSQPGAAPYPTSTSNYPPQGGAPPAAASYGGGSAPYPSNTGDGGNAPYPAAGGSAPYPAAGASASGSPYPSTTSSHQPSAAGSSAPPSAPASYSSDTSGAKTTTKHGSSSTADENSTPYYTNAKEPGDSGTVSPLLSGFNAEADATQIRNCLKSVSINETVIVNILPHRSNAQRQKIRLMYKTMYGKDLIQDLRDRLSGDFESITAGLLMTPAEYDAYVINKAIQGAGTDEEALIQVLCTRTNAQVAEVSQQYKQMYKRSIEQDIKGDTSGHFRRMLISLSNGARQEDQGVNQQKADDDAKKLYKAGAARLGTDESTFNSIFVSQSFQQLRAVFASYKRLYNKDMEKVIKSEMSGDLERGMKAIVRFTLDKHSYFANVLYKAMKGLGTDEKTLIRILVSRSEIDLEQIKRSFSSIKGESKSLAHWIKKETSGPFRDMLIHLIGGAS